MKNIKTGAILFVMVLTAVMLLSACGTSDDLDNVGHDIVKIGQEVVVDPDVEQVKEVLEPEETEEIEEEAPAERTYTPFTADELEDARYLDVMNELRKVNARLDDYNHDLVCLDASEYMFMGPDNGQSLCYDFVDLNGDGTLELIIGGSGDNSWPLGVYTIKNGQAYLPDLCYFYNIYSDGIIHTYQGNGITEGHEDGFYFRVRSDGGVEETSAGSETPMTFDWKPLV